MLVKLRTTVVSDWTTEVESRAEAEAKRAALEADEQSHCHHGERVTVEIVPIVEPGGRVRFCEWMTGPTDMHGRHTLRVKSTGHAGEVVPVDVATLAVWLAVDTWWRNRAAAAIEQLRAGEPATSPPSTL